MSPYSMGFVVKAVVLTVCGLYFFVRFYRKGPPFWLGIILITTGWFDFRFQLEAWLAGYSGSDSIRMLVQIAIHLMFIGANTLYHYFVLLFYLDSAGILKRYMYVVLLLPLVAAFLFRTKLYPDLQFDYLFAAIWGTLYWSASLVLAIRRMIREYPREKIIFHLAIALILLSNGFILILAHYQGKEFVEMVDMTGFTIFLACCLLLLLWVNMKKVLAGMQREAVVRKLDMGTALLHHSFKNAIGKIKINAWNIRNSLAKQTELPERWVEEIDGYVQNLFLTYEHMMGMMAKISQIVKNKVEIRPEPVDLPALLDEAVKAAGRTHVQVVKQVEPAVVEADKALVLECLINIIHNAADAMRGEGTMTVSTEKKGRHVYVSLADTGSGMTKEQLTQIFEPFYTTKGRTGKNMGLGMYYVRKVMEAHKGKITLKSEPGKGTTVTLQFRQARKGSGWIK